MLAEAQDHHWPAPLCALIPLFPGEETGAGTTHPRGPVFANCPLNPPPGPPRPQPGATASMLTAGSDCRRPAPPPGFECSRLRTDPQFPTCTAFHRAAAICGWGDPKEGGWN